MKIFKDGALHSELSLDEFITLAQPSDDLLLEIELGLALGNYSINFDLWGLLPVTLEC